MIKGTSVIDESCKLELFMKDFDEIAEIYKQVKDAEKIRRLIEYVINLTIHGVLDINRSLRRFEKAADSHDESPTYSGFLMTRHVAFEAQLRIAIYRNIAVSLRKVALPDEEISDEEYQKFMELKRDIKLRYKYEYKDIKSAYEKLKKLQEDLRDEADSAVS
jgi:hypothetical protein